MLKVLILCFAIVPILYGNPVGKIGGKTNSTITVHDKITLINSTKLAIASEGGAIMSNSPALSLAKESSAFVMTSPANISSNKVKPRKGAPVEDSGNISIEQNPISVNNYVKNNANANTKTGDTKNVANLSLTSPPTIIKKPLIVSVELIEKADLLNSDPPVDDVDERVVKIHNTSTKGHPGMITPIIITVLVVPIFVMIGYMVLKRGQEAWKNRHYKRMDFLLDGMYND